MTDIRKQVLGRGLSALLESSQEENQVNNSSLEIPIINVEASSTQPRRSFPEQELQALAVSIQDKGILQPILVRPHPRLEGKYEIVAGERRWRAAKRVGLEAVPVLIRELSDGEALEIGLLENLQRQDLDPIDEAGGYRRLAEEFDHTQETLSRIVGKSRSHIANTLRLLTLPENVKAYLREGKLSAGHGRALIGARDPEFLAELIIEKNLSVRQAEILSKKKLTRKEARSYAKNPDPEGEILGQQLSDLLGLPVNLVLKGEGGKVLITFKNPDELDQILQKFNRIGEPTPPPPSISVLY